MRILVTGASGFVGSALRGRLVAIGHEVTGIYRAAPSRGAGPALIGALEANQDWSALPRDCDALVHTAARVHILNDRARDPLAEYRRTNVEGTLNLARQAAQAGLRRFVFLSTIKVNGEHTGANAAFSADDVPSPSDPYGASKWEAEQGLKDIAARTGLELVIIRPPLVYGPGVKGNFRSMLEWLWRGLPLPLAAVTNRRSMIYLDNLLDVIVVALAHPAARNRTFLVSDAEHMSTPELLRRTGSALGRGARLFSVPPSWLAAAAALAGRRPAFQRLCGSLVVDSRQTHRLLGWEPATSVDAGLERTAKDFLRETRA